MASKTTQQSSKKRPTKPKTQYSPSDPVSTKMYHLINTDDTRSMTIVANSSVKRRTSDGTVMLNDGRTAKLIVSDDDDQDQDLDQDQDHDVDDEESGLMQQTLQMPMTTFLTPAPFRRRTTLTNRSGSPDSIFSVSSSRQFPNQNRPSYSTKHKTDRTNGPSTSRNPMRTSTEINSKLPRLSDEEEEEEEMDTSDNASLSRILQELQNTRAELQDARTENGGISRQLAKLTKKFDRFGSAGLLKNDQELDRYRDDPDNAENFKKEINYDNLNLLDVSARNVGEYARNLLKILFKPDELQSGLLPSQHSKRFLKSELENKRMDLLNEAVRTRYRISKHHYASFYKERIQESLAACLYNEGTRKQKKQAMQLQRQAPQQPNTTAGALPSTNINNSVNGVIPMAHTDK